MEYPIYFHGQGFTDLQFALYSLVGLLIAEVLVRVAGAIWRRLHNPVVAKYEWRDPREGWKRVK